MWDHEIIPAPGAPGQPGGGLAVCAGTRSIEGRADEACGQLIQRDGSGWYHVAQRTAPRQGEW